MGSVSSIDIEKMIINVEHLRNWKELVAVYVGIISRNSPGVAE
jgi:hypothetical protein